MSHDLWGEVALKLRQKVGSETFNTWFRPTRLVSRGAGRLTVSTPNPMFAEWLRNNYLSLLAESVQEVDGRSWEIVFTSPQSGSAEPAAAVPALPPQLDPRYTFETFVVGAGNQFAHAAARAVADSSSNGFNPLYVYGGTGLGKTHLMQAIGNEVAAGGRYRRFKYISTETFVNELINAIRFGKTSEFRDRYRNIDLLLIDDIQFLASKERTQEEFFHTFNTLYEARRQIVLTSDAAPKDIPKLEQRLRSRFAWGLLVDIQPPELETKIAILYKKASSQGLELPSDVALFIATNIKSNVRELEGALNRVCAYSALKVRPITLDLTKECLNEFLSVEPAIITIELIQKVIADHYDLQVSELKSRNNSPSVSFPRQIAMYFCKALTGKSLPEIGRRFGGKHHSTVIHAIQKIEAKRSREPQFDRLLNSLAERFH